MMFPTKFEIESIVFILIKLTKPKELINLLCRRFLYLHEYESQQNKHTIDIPTIDSSYYHNEQNK